MHVTSLRQCSNKCKLAREGLNKEVIFFVSGFPALDRLHPAAHRLQRSLQTRGGAVLPLPAYQQETQLLRRSSTIIFTLGALQPEVLGAATIHVSLML